jgi:geranylgeranyl reductase family protein
MLSMTSPLSSRRWDAIVVGAGPAGSATATLLADAGYQVLMIDRARFPRPKPCAEYLSPAATGLLDRLGVLPAVEAHAPARLTGMRVVSPDGTSFVGRFVSEHEYAAPCGYGLALPREHLDQAPAQNARAHGVEFREGVSLESIATSPEGPVALTVRDTSGVQDMQARLVIAADGLNSRVARRLRLTRRAGRPRVALVTHLRNVSGMTDVGEMHVAYNGYVGLAQVGQGITNVAVVADVGRAPPQGPATRWFADMLHNFPEVLRRVQDAEQVTRVRGVGPFARKTRRATADGVLLVGDAADFHDPFTGEGIYAALAGAEMAARAGATALASGKLSAADLSPYDRARRHAFAGKWLFERVVSAAVAHPLVFNRIASRLARNRVAADLMVGAAGDFVPVSRLLRPSYLWRLVA